MTVSVSMLRRGDLLKLFLTELRVVILLVFDWVVVRSLKVGVADGLSLELPLLRVTVLLLDDWHCSGFSDFGDPVILLLLLPLSC